LVDELCVEFDPLVFGDVAAGADVAEETRLTMEPRPCIESRQVMTET
jgi:hypothetical protein